MLILVCSADKYSASLCNTYNDMVTYKDLCCCKQSVYEDRAKLDLTQHSILRPLDLFELVL